MNYHYITWEGCCHDLPMWLVEEALDKLYSFIPLTFLETVLFFYFEKVKRGDLFLFFQHPLPIGQDQSPWLRYRKLKSTPTSCHSYPYTPVRSSLTGSLSLGHSTCFHKSKPCPCFSFHLEHPSQSCHWLIGEGFRRNYIFFNLSSCFQAQVSIVIFSVLP